MAERRPPRQALMLPGPPGPAARPVFRDGRLLHACGHRLVAGIGAALLILALLPVHPAAAHVSVDPVNTPAQGGWGNVTFQVPTESQDASTTRLEFTFIEETAFTALRTRPVPGWSAQIDRADDGTVERLVWEAAEEQDGIAPGEFQSFTLFAGPWPQAESAAVPVAQRYSDGSVVEWNERALDEAAELDYPAPVVPLAAAGGTDEHGGITSDEGDPARAEEDRSATAPANGSGPGWVTTGVAVTALALALAALGYAGALHRRLRSG